jgi:hypothetical protein
MTSLLYLSLWIKAMVSWNRPWPPPSWLTHNTTLTLLSCLNLAPTEKLMKLCKFTSESSFVYFSAFYILTYSNSSHHFWPYYFLFREWDTSWWAGCLTRKSQRFCLYSVNAGCKTVHIYCGITIAAESAGVQHTS